MSTAVVVPPLKSQGIKTHLVPYICLLEGCVGAERLVEPFFGTGVTAFNSPLKARVLANDLNPHTVSVYSSIKNEILTSDTVRVHLERESVLLRERGVAHYNEVRDRFNDSHDPHDYIFLSRAGFNGLVRFNRKGGYNVPFCNKNERFSSAYVTKICNQVARVAEIIHSGDYEFRCEDFRSIISEVKETDLIYADPPYLGRSSDYYSEWGENDELALLGLLKGTKAKFVRSVWHHKEVRENPYLCMWKDFNMVTVDHYYHLGGELSNRRGMTEALIFNFEIPGSIKAAFKGD